MLAIFREDRALKLFPGTAIDRNSTEYTNYTFSKIFQGLTSRASQIPHYGFTSTLLFISGGYNLSILPKHLGIKYRYV